MTGAITREKDNKEWLRKARDQVKLDQQSAGK